MCTIAKIVCALTLLVVISAGCEEYLDERFDSNGNNYLVVEGGITTDTTRHMIVLSRSGDYFDKDPRNPVQEAEVTISDGLNDFRLNETEPGIYLTDSTVFGVAGKTYTLDIRLDDGSEYFASETIRALPGIDSIKFRKETGFDEDAGERTGGYELLYYGQEPPGKGDHYLWSLYIGNELYTDSLHEKAFNSDEFVDGSYIRDIELFFIPWAHLPDDSVEIRLEMFSISGDYFDYIIGIMLETRWRGSPWDGPPANAVGNISKGALGYFTASDKRTASAMLKREEPI